MADAPNHITCDACGTSFETFCEGQAHGLDTSRNSDGDLIGGNYGSKHDCCHFTIVDTASFPGDNICDACLDDMLADGRLVDPCEVNLATGETFRIESATDEEMAEILYEPDLLRDVAEVVEMSVEELRAKPDVPFVVGATGDAEFSVYVRVYRNDEDSKIIRDMREFAEAMRSVGLDVEEF